MENASKALLIAGGILIGMLILSLFVYELYYAGSVGNAYQAEISETQILEFNAQFEKYQNTNMTAQEVVTIYNYIEEYWNPNNISDQIELTRTTPINYIISNGTANFLNNYSGYYNSDGDYIAYTYSLTITEYASTGRVSKITIVRNSTY